MSSPPATACPGPSLHVPTAPVPQDLVEFHRFLHVVDHWVIAPQGRDFCLFDPLCPSWCLVDSGQVGWQFVWPQTSKSQGLTWIWYASDKSRELVGHWEAPRQRAGVERGPGVMGELLLLAPGAGTMGRPWSRAHRVLVENVGGRDGARLCGSLGCDSS